MNEEFQLNLGGDILNELKAIRAEYGQLLKVVEGMDEAVKEGFDAMKHGAESASRSMRVLVMDVLGRSVDLFGEPFRNGTESVYDFDESLRELSAITDITGSELTGLGDLARDMTGEFGGTPQEHLRTYTLLLSKLTPEIAHNEEAMDSFGTTAAMLGNTMQGDVVGAVGAITTAMNQYGVSLADPIAASKEAAEMANVIAAAAKVGAVEVPGLNDAIAKSGAVAKQVNVEFVELNAALEVAGKYFETGAQAGTAMRNVMLRLNRGEFLTADVIEGLESAGVNVDRLTDKSLTLADRLRELQKASDSDALLAKMFGDENAVGAVGLLNNIDLIEQYKQQIIDMPNALEDMNDTIMGGYRKQKQLLDAFLNDLRLGFFETFGGALPYLDLVGSGLSDIIQIAPGLESIVALSKEFGLASKLMGYWQGIASIATWGWTAASSALSAIWAANSIGIVIVGIAALTAGIIYLWRNFDGFRGSVMGLWESFKTVFNNISNFFGEMLAPVFEAISLFMAGDYSGAAKAAAKGAWNLATLPMQFGKAMLDGDITQGIGEAWDKGYKRGVAMGDQKEGVASAADGTAKAPAASPMVPSFSSESSNAGSASSSGKGGGSAKSVIVTIQSLIGELNIIAEGGRIDRRMIQEEVKMALIGGVRDFEVAMG